jgi:hypothetical protein
MLKLHQYCPRVGLDRMFDGVTLAEGCMKSSVVGAREGPSTESMPTAPSCPMTEVATVCPFGMSSMNEIVPLWGK